MTKTERQAVELLRTLPAQGLSNYRIYSHIWKDEADDAADTIERLCAIADAADRYWTLETNCDRSECDACSVGCDLKYIGAALQKRR
jgi:hypothetical protein